MTTIRVGYVPLSDALPLLHAQRHGLDQAEGLTLELVSMASWAQLRDALLTADIRAAHCLPGIALAAQAGLYGATPALATAFTLNHSGNSITLRADWAADPDSLHHGLRSQPQGRLPTFASVFPVSKHSFELRYWLQTQGIDPDREVQLQVLPPPTMAQALAEGRIDGFCAGEPWGSLTELQEGGRIVATSESLGLPSTEKVLAVQEDWLNSAEHAALLRCLHQSCRQLERPEHRRQGVSLLAQALGIAEEAIAPALLDSGPFACGDAQATFMRFAGINRPDTRHANWLMLQILQGPRAQLSASSSPAALCLRTFRSDIYDTVLGR